MTVIAIKCSNCSGNLDVPEGVNRFVCNYCGTANLLTIVDVPKPGVTGLVCPSCGVWNKEESIFCSKCGTALQKKCPFCKEAHTIDTVFCPKTGGNIVEYKDDENIKTVQPVSTQQTEENKTIKDSETLPKKGNWNEELFIKELAKTKEGTEVIPIVKEILEWGKKKNLLKIWWGSGKTTGHFHFKLNNVQFLQVITELKFSVWIQITKNMSPFDNPHSFEELFKRMKEIFGNLLSNEVKDKGITLPLKTLSGNKLYEFINVLDWVLNKVEQG